MLRAWRCVAVAATVGLVLPRTVGAGPAAGAEQPLGLPPITVTALIGPGGVPMESASMISARGVVTGAVPGTAEFFNPPVPVVWQRGVASFIAPDGALPPPTPLDVSGRGEIVGTRVHPAGLSWPYSWRQGVYTSIVPEVLSLPTEGGSVAFGAAHAVNDRGEVLGCHVVVTVAGGEATIARETVVWDDGEVTARADRPAHPRDINDRGQALVNVGGACPLGPDDGNTMAATWQTRGVVGDAPSAVTELGTLGGASSEGQAINERGQVAGVSDTASGDEHVFLWSGGNGGNGGRMRDLGTLGGATSTMWPSFDPQGLWVVGPSRGLNESGQVVGTSETATGERHAFLWSGGRMRDLGTLGGAASEATAVNDRGQVVGASQTASGAWHAVLWERGRTIDLTALAGGTSGWASDINDRGQIVGSNTGGAVMWTAPPARR